MELTRYLSKQELQYLVADKDRVRQDLVDNYNLNITLSRSFNTKVFEEARLLLEGKPIPRAKNPKPTRNGKITVRNVTPEEMEKLWR